MAILVRQTLTADNADVLNGTDLENLPTGGTLFVRAASTQSDTEMTITGRGFEPPVRGQVLTLRTNGMPTEDDDAIPIDVPDGGKVLIDINVVTAATVVVEALWM